MDFDDLGHEYRPLIIRPNAKGSDYSQFWTSETPTFWPDGTEAPQKDWLGYVRCGVCGRPLGSYVMVPGPQSDQYAETGRPAHFNKWLGWAWKLSHPNKRHPGRPQEYHEECRLMMDGWDRWSKAQRKVRFDAVYGTALIQRWQQRLQEARNSDFGSGRFSPSARRAIFGSSTRDKRTRKERKSRRSLK